MNKNEVDPIPSGEDEEISSSSSSQDSVRDNRSILKSPTKKVSVQDGGTTRNIEKVQSSDDSEARTSDRSSIDVSSISLTEDEEPKLTFDASKMHNHIMPKGWVCTHDSENDEYRFELEENGRQQRFRAKSESKKLQQLSLKDEFVEAISPTMDHEVQTSRKPSLNLIECKYGYHFPSSPTPSMLSELAKHVQKGPGAVTATSKSKVKEYGYGKTKLTMMSDEEAQLRRLKEMFPTATGPVIEQMIKNYQGREGCIKAALISFGYKRAADYGGQQATAQSPIMLMMAKPSSKKLFDKLVSYFPDKDESLIKNLMFKHKEVEHEIISILVESGGGLDLDGHSKGDEKMHEKKYDKNGAIMKLRYLKFLFPTCEEIELYHLLHCNNLNAQKVIEEVEKKGHKRANIDEVMKNRKTQTQQMKAQQAALAAKDKSAVADPLQVHKNRKKPVVTAARANELKENIKKSFEEGKIYDDGLILGALEAADYSESLAKKFLKDMQPIDEELYKQRYLIPRDKEPDVVLFPSKAVQMGGSCLIETHFGECVLIPRDVTDCKHALALLKVDACTFTQDDFIPTKFTHAKGKQEDLAKGSIFKSIEIKDSLRRGANQALRAGTCYNEMICTDKRRAKPNEKASGRNKSLIKGRNPSLNHGHNLKLVQRMHPFFQNTKQVH